jgi:hypothetical protein
MAAAPGFDREGDTGAVVRRPRKARVQRARPVRIGAARRDQSEECEDPQGAATPSVARAAAGVSV